MFKKKTSSSVDTELLGISVDEVGTVFEVTPEVKALFHTKIDNIVTLSGLIENSLSGTVTAGTSQFTIRVNYPLPLKSGTELAGTASVSGQFPLGTPDIFDSGSSVGFTIFPVSLTPNIKLGFVITYETA